jgi:glycosyltransferase involved in cell wall biosynthesis
MEKPYLTVVTPCFNEEANLRRGVLGEINNFLRKQDFAWEVIVSDDGSSDKSREIVRVEIKSWDNFRLVENPHGGKPAALLSGIKEARGKYLLLTDMDQSTPIGEFAKLRPYLTKGYDVVIGSRGLVRKNFSLYRRLGAVVFSTLRRVLILPEIADTQCGFKLFRADILKKAFPRLEFFRRKERAVGWKVTSFDVELLHILKKMGESIAEVAVVWNDRDVSKGKGGSLSRYIRESKEMFLQVIRVRINEMRGLYK